MRRYLFLLTFCFVELLTLDADALPRFALRGGEAWCGGCHVNPTGGGMRTEGGDNFAMNRLPMWKRTQPFSTSISEGIRIGVDMRSQYLYFSDHITSDEYDTTVRIKGAHEMALPLYISATLSPAIQAYVRMDPVTTGAWEGYGILQFVHPSGDIWQSTSWLQNAYVKIGAFLPTFGVRFDDHTIYTRGGNASLSEFGAAGLFWQPNYKDEGVELGFYLFDQMLITADLLNGNEMAPVSSFKVDPAGPHAVSMRAEIAHSFIEHELTAQIGGSMYLHSYESLPSANKLNDSSAQTRVFAIHGGIDVGPVRILAEADFGSFIFHPISGQFSNHVKAVAVETAVDIADGLTGLLRFDDYRDGVTEDLTHTETRFMAGFQWFPLRFLEFRPEFRYAKAHTPSAQDPTIVIDQDQTTVLLQTHIFF